MKEFPAIVIGMHIHEEVEKFDKRTQTMVIVPAKPEDAFTYDLKYGDGAVERGAKATWVTFDARPNLEPAVSVAMGCCWMDGGMGWRSSQSAFVERECDREPHP